MKKKILVVLLMGIFGVNTPVNALGLSTITTPIKISVKGTAAIVLNVAGVGLGLAVIGGGGVLCIANRPEGWVALPLGVATTVLSLHYGLLLTKSALKDVLNYNENNTQPPKVS